MEKSLRILALAAVLGGVGIVAAQQSAARAKAPVPARSSVPAASAGRSMLSSNGVTETLVGYFCAKQLLEIERANRDGRPDRADAVIRANCSALLTLMTPEQQKAEIAEWQMERYRKGNDHWAAVARTRSMVDRLLKIDAATDAKALKALEEARDAIFGGFRALDAKIAASPEFKAARSKDEQRRIHATLYERLRPRFDPIERQAEVAGYHAKAVEEVRKLLTPAQKAEYDLIRSRFEAAVRAAATGKPAL